MAARDLFLGSNFYFYVLWSHYLVSQQSTFAIIILINNWLKFYSSLVRKATDILLMNGIVIFAHFYNYFLLLKPIARATESSFSRAASRDDGTLTAQISGKRVIGSMNAAKLDYFGRSKRWSGSALVESDLKLTIIENGLSNKIIENNTNMPYRRCSCVPFSSYTQSFPCQMTELI